ncbi:hypothetical protein [Aphanothece hegewaldii]|nr:hypothetical protein [Aphanothece hegewaldii]
MKTSLNSNLPLIRSLVSLHSLIQFNPIMFDELTELELLED